MNAAHYRVAAIQFEPVFGDKAANIAALVGLTEAAAADGARLIVLPEMATTGYCWESRAEIAPCVEPVPGPTTDRFAAIAARYDCFLVVGMPEVAAATGVYYNTAVLIGPDGVIGIYRKTHSYISEPKWAKDGDLGIPVFATPLGRIAITICMDATYPEAIRVPALAGADVICFPTNWLSEKSPSPSWMARAVESGVWLIAANRYGLERGVQFSGGSGIIDPDGSIQACRDIGDGIVFGTVDVAAARRKATPDGSGDRLADRVPSAYGNLTLNAYLWNPRSFHKLYDRRPLPVGRRSVVAVAQITPRFGEVETNLAKIETIVAATEADLIVFPELAACGPIEWIEAADRVAEPIPGPTTDRLSELAAAHRHWLIVGMVERDGDRRFNAAVVIGPDGVVGRYRKVHLSQSDRLWASAGDAGLPTFDLPLGRVGVLIGYDALFPEAARVLALDGADLIACPSLVEWPPVRGLGATEIPFAPAVERGPTEDHFHLWRERATENNTYVAFANGGDRWMGWSGVFGGDLEGEERHEAMVRHADDGVATLPIDTTNLETPYLTNRIRAKDLLGMRMPIWYDSLQTEQRQPARVDAAMQPLVERLVRA